MSSKLLPRVVIDTNVLFEGLTQKGNAPGFIIDAWEASLLNVCVSTALVYEYRDVLSRKLSTRRWHKAQTVLAILLESVEFIQIHYSWRPTSPDPGDDLMIDCAMNAGATLITLNLRDFRRARESLGLQVMSPNVFVIALASGEL